MSILTLFLILGESILLFTIKYAGSCSFLINALYWAEVVPFYFQLLRAFIMKGAEFSNVFSFPLIRSYDFWMLNHPCILEQVPLDCDIKLLVYIVGLYLVIFCWGFLSSSSWERLLVCIIVFFCAFSGFSVHIIQAWEVLLPLLFSGRDWVKLVLILLYMFGQVLKWIPPGPGDFFWGSFKLQILFL